jgi:hypothetical protein
MGRLAPFSESCHLLAELHRFGRYLCLFVGSVVAGIGAAGLRPLGFAVNIIFAVVVAYLGIVVGRWLFGRKNL